MARAAHGTAGLIALWLTCGFAHAFIRVEQGRFTLPRIRLFQRKPKLRVLPDLPTGKSESGRAMPEKSGSMAEVDALLDKIAQHGMGSLTPKERAKLDQARAALIKRGR